MKSLNEVVSDLRKAIAAKDAAKENWTTLMREGDDGQHEARQAFLAADSVYSERAMELQQTLTELRQIFCLEGVIDSMEKDEKVVFCRLIAELRFDHLIAPEMPRNLEQLATLWRRAGAILTAAREMKQRLDRGDGEHIATILGASEEARDPEAWKQAALVYDLIDVTNTAMYGDPYSRYGDNLHEVGRHLLRQYDRLTEQMQTVLQDLHDSGRLSEELNDMDAELRRCIQNAIGGLVRQRQVQVQTKPETRPVTTAEPEVDTDADTEFGE
jgi:hypothetical protein